jgi:hypothetical protein
VDVAQAFAAYRQKSCIRAGEAGPDDSNWLSTMAAVPVAGVMYPAVPVPPAQP